jgi:opacity protein-like surface antigen
MKRIAVIAVLFCLTLAPIAGAQIDNNIGKLGFGVDGGLFIPASGDFTADSSFSDFFSVGPGFGAHVNYTICKQAAVRGGFSYTFLKMKDEARGNMTNKPYLATPYLYLDGILNFGGFMKPGSTINPYLAAGAGFYTWKVTDDGVGGDAIKLANNEEFKNTSLGIHFGPGVEFFATPALSIFAEGKYHLIFTKDNDKFGPEFKNLGAVDATVGLTYHFSLGRK